MEVLGGLVLEEHLLPAVLDILGPTDFVSTERAEVLSKMISMQAAGTPIDIITLGHQLDGTCKKSSTEWMLFLTQLWGAVPTSAGILHYAKIVRELSVRRRLARELARRGEAVLNGAESPVAAVEALSEIFDEVRRWFEAEAVNK
jgi:replicative DNA helicase